jgi:hypothetical protein
MEKITKLNILKRNIVRANKDLAEYQESCKHKEATFKYGSNTGNWCPADDAYWKTFDCPRCGKHWSEDQ